ncbi:condensation domain-containing protein [Saccharothrix variisporea]|uniref:Condensation domain-containing protein n=1 Tax=Saccharothrix variisporea TaxID=543527 RepID=A0A495XPL5_9PSEU|nr:condensation domain-containing protein [Saccharothrix variisporea]RKT74844.1 condensation domain-containing protein [Saccharothrix variisporea]
MIVVSRAEVEFHGGQARTGPVTWAQQSTWDGMCRWLPDVKPFFTLPRWLDVPLLLELGDVLDVLGKLVLRHESLRTHFDVSANGEVTQRVVGSGTLPVEVHDRPADDPVQFGDIVGDCWRRGAETPFDHGGELPIRLSVALHEGIPVLVVFVVSHLAADHTGADLLAAELTALLRARVDGVAPPAPRKALQPLDIARYERSPEGQLRNVEALRHLRTQLQRMPAYFGRAEPATPRYVGADLASDVLPVAVRRAARRCRTTTSVVLLAITTALVGRVWPGPRCRLDVMQGNRVTPELLGSVTTLNQVVRTVVDLDGDSFTDLLRRAEHTMREARAVSRYDTRAEQEVLRAWGGVLAPGVQFNDMWSLLPKPRTTPTDPDPATTELTWPATSEAEDMALYLDIKGTPERMVLGLMADTAVLTREEIGAFLRTFEHLATALAEHGGEYHLAHADPRGPDAGGRSRPDRDGQAGRPPRSPDRPEPQHPSHPPSGVGAGGGRRPG